MIRLYSNFMMVQREMEKKELERRVKTKKFLFAPSVRSAIYPHRVRLAAEYIYSRAHPALFALKACGNAPTRDYCPAATAFTFHV